MTIEFIEFPKMPRLKRECIITEKIDGTNACIKITEDGQFLTGSRTRWITPDDDNYGFSRWAHEHKDELMGLGVGTHFGEWWGSGCQRGYGLSKGEKRWSLFNVARWCLHGTVPEPIPSADPRIVKWQQKLPACCHLVPVLFRGEFDTRRVDEALDWLRREGSQAAPGFMKPEGVVCFHVAGNFGFKTTLEKDHEYKGKAAAATPTQPVITKCKQCGQVVGEFPKSKYCPYGSDPDGKNSHKYEKVASAATSESKTTKGTE